MASCYSLSAQADLPLAVESVLPKQVNSAKLIILIDDMGHSLSRNQAALNLPGAVSFAFLPHAHFSQRLAKQAYASDKDVLLHAPMQTIYNHSLGKGGMTDAMSEQQFKQVLRENIAAIPHAVGVNNHMGSKLTSLSLQMQWTMEVIKQHGLFFVDSRTTGKSVAWVQASQQGVANLRRDVFLDHVISLKAMQYQYAKAIRIAKEEGLALLIAHPHTLSLKFLKEQIPLLSEQQVELVSLSSQLGFKIEKSPVVLNQ